MIQAQTEFEDTVIKDNTKKYLIGGRASFTAITSKESNHVPLSRGATTMAIGGVVQASPVPWLTLESGFRYHRLNLGGFFSSDLNINEFRIPAVAKFVMPSGSERFFIGAGIFYFMEQSAKYKKTLAQQPAINVPDKDMVSDIGYSVVLGANGYYFSDRVLTITEVSFDYSERMLDIIFRELNLNIGFGIAF